jgi:hypothetical protein
MNLSTRTSPVLVNGAAAAAQTTVTPAHGVYVPPGCAVLLIGAFGTVSATSVSGMQCQVSNDDGVADSYSAIGGSSVAAPVGAGGLVLIDVPRPLKPWVLPVVTRTVANAVLLGIVALVYDLSQMPPTADASVIGSKLLAAGAPLGAA